MSKCYSCTDEQYKDSYTYIFNKYKEKMEKISKLEVGTASYDFAMDALEPLRDDLKYGKGGNTGICEYQCPMYSDKCRFISENLKEQIEHENECLGINRPLPSDDEYDIATKIYKCPNVGCEFYAYDHGTVKGQYALNRHMTTCKKSLGKKLRKRIKEGLGNLGLNELQTLIKLAEKNNISFT
jgi:hypothetical protein